MNTVPPHYIITLVRKGSRAPDPGDCRLASWFDSTRFEQSKRGDKVQDGVRPPVEELARPLIEDVARRPPCAPAAAWREARVQNAGPHLPRPPHGDRHTHFQ